MLSQQFFTICILKTLRMVCFARLSSAMNLTLDTSWNQNSKTSINGRKALKNFIGYLGLLVVFMINTVFCTTKNFGLLNSITL